MKQVFAQAIAITLALAVTQGAWAADKATKAQVIEGYEAINARMHRDMHAPMTGDADVDFVTGMVPHHQGAVDMAEFLLKHGDDPELKAMANGIIIAQRREIAFMRAWAKRKGIKIPGGEAD